MLDPKLLRTELQEIAEKLKLRGYSLDISSIDELEERRKTLQVRNPGLAEPA